MGATRSSNTQTGVAAIAIAQATIAALNDKPYTTSVSPALIACVSARYSQIVDAANHQRLDRNQRPCGWVGPSCWQTSSDAIVSSVRVAPSEMAMAICGNSAR
jgi:hypothetical protein